MHPGVPIVHGIYSTRSMRGLTVFSLAVLTTLSCESSPSRDGQVPGAVLISAGTYHLGSDSVERSLGYDLSPPTVYRARWYDAWERAPYTMELDGFHIDSTPVTQHQYAEFVAATSHRTPYINRADYLDQRFLVHRYDEVIPFLWQNGRPDSQLLDHPVVLVDRDDATAYCEWTGARLPSEHEWEAACRGMRGRTFPWGDTWRNQVAHIDTTFTASVSAHPAAATPTGVADLAGNVFEWTGSPFAEGSAVLKGCSWDDAAGTCRCAFRHGRPAASRHILIGFRCVRDP